MLPFLIVLHILIAIALIGLVLIQRGRGADIGAAFGSGASQTVFGARGSASFLTRATGVLAALFFISSLVLTYFYSQRTERGSVTELTAPVAGDETPAGPADLPRLPDEPSSAPEEAPGQSGQQ
ncbi:MAG: preprotein translocase subunit SecG [Gammaproteobacteria bacterium]|nr:preprotein translocase subunit SecG [Gammaproteobacteria bacterium]